MAEKYLDRGLSVCEGGETAPGCCSWQRGYRSSRSRLASLAGCCAPTWPGGRTSSIRCWRFAITADRSRLSLSAAMASWPQPEAMPARSACGMARAQNRSVSRSPARTRSRSLVFSPDSRVLAILCRDGDLRFWDIRTQQFCPAAFAHGEGVQSIIYSRDGKMVAVEGADHALRFFSTEQGKPLPLVVKHARRVKMASITPDNKTIVTITDDGTIQLWVATTGRKREATAIHPRLSAADLSGDGRWLATASGDRTDRTVRVWDAASLKLQHEMIHTSPVEAVAFSPDCRTLLTGCSDKSARAWNAATGESLGTVAFHEHSVSARDVQSRCKPDRHVRHRRRHPDSLEQKRNAAMYRDSTSRESRGRAFQRGRPHGIDWHEARR